MNITYSQKAAKAINGMDSATKNRIKAGILGLTHKPPLGDIKVMQGFSDGRCRLRVGKYRIIYRYVTGGKVEVLHIMDIGSRGDIYK